MSRMQTGRIKICMAFFCMMTVLGLAGCKGKTQRADLSLTETSVTMEKWEDYTLNIKGVDDKKVKWSSDDKKVVEVKDGVVYAKGEGSAVVTATVKDTSVSCTVFVQDNHFIPTVNLHEPKDGVNMVKNGEYVLYPELTYNGKAYTDAEYTYSVDGKNLSVDENGCIKSSDLGEGIVTVTASWRDQEVTEHLKVDVLDVSTSIEVDDDAYTLYLNGEGIKWPSSADLGIVVFDSDQWIQKPGSAVTYREISQKGDTKGAVTVSDGIAHAKKVGTTHVVASYQPKKGAVVKSALVTINVEKSPADIYMTPIEGKDFEFFFEALGEDNSVKWEEKSESFHLINKTTTLSDDRGFIINREYLQNIVKYTKAESISFEYRTDGKQTGLKTDDQVIYQGFYPNWYDEKNVQRYRLSEKWTKVEYRFDAFPNDEDGIMKTLFLMNAVEGMYIRNVKLYLPGEDRTNYDPGHNYLEDIEGTEYEFFIEALGDANSVKWDEKSKSYILRNNVAEMGDERGFIFNRDYLTNVIKHTKAESISFEYRTDGRQTGLKTDDQVIYQGFYPNWYDTDHIQRLSLSRKWNKIEIKLKDITKDENDAYKTIFLMNTIGGMELRNIRFHVAGEDRTNYDKKHNYMEEIKGTEYEFFIEALGEKNSVKWDKMTQSYHLKNKTKAEGDDRGFIFDRDYLTNIIKHTKAESISFEIKTDGKNTGLKTNDQVIYQGFYPNWYNEGQYQRISLSEKWTKIEIFFKDIPKDENGNYKTVFLMNTVEGMYIRNFKLYKKGEDRTNYDKEYDYLTKIEGKSFEFFIESLGDNAVKWDSSLKAYHLKNTVAEASDQRGFIFNRDYLTNVIRHTKATSISFEYRFDGQFSGFVTDDQVIYQGFYPNWFDSENVTRNSVVTKWNKIEIDFADIPKDANGNYKTIFLMNTIGGMYIRNITLHVPGAEQDTQIKDDHNYLEEIQGADYAFFMETLSEDNSVTWDKNEKQYHLTNQVAAAGDGRGFTLSSEYIQGIMKNTTATSLTLEFKNDSERTDLATDDQCIYTGYYPDWYGTSQMQRYNLDDQWHKMEIKFSDIPKDEKGNLKAPFLMNTVGGLYIWNITLHFPKVYEVRDSLDLAYSNMTWTKGEKTGLTGGNDTGTLYYTDNGFKIVDSYAYATHKFMLKTPAGAYGDDMTLRLWIKATPNMAGVGDLVLYFYKYDQTGGIGSGIEKARVTIPAQGEWVSAEIDLTPFLDEDKKLQGLAFATFGYKDWTSEQMYTIEIDKMEILSSHEQP